MNVAKSPDFVARPGWCSQSTIHSLLRLFLLLMSLPLLPVPAQAVDLPPSEEPRIPLAMEVLLKKPVDRQYELHIHLTNTSPEPVMVDIRDLPWNPPHDSTWIHAVQAESGRNLMDKDVRPWKFGSRMVRLLPGESIQDIMPLNAKIPTLLEEIDRYGVRLHWECPPVGLKFFCQPDSPTEILIPRKDPGTADVYTIDTAACRKTEQSIGLISIPAEHHVLFLLITEATMTNLQRMESLLLRIDEYVRSCLPTWTNSWAASFFTEAQLAGFLTDESNRRLFEEGRWQNVNIGQYASQIRTLFRFPWIKKKSDIVYLSIYGLQQDGLRHSHKNGPGRQ